MAITAVCECGASYSLKDEFAGQTVRCPACQNSFVVPASARIAQADPIFDRDKFLIRQKRIAISEKYFVGDESGREIAFVHRPAAIWRILLIAFLSAAWIIGTIFAFAMMTRGLDDRQHVAIVLQSILLVVFSIIGLFVIIWRLAPRRHISFYRDQNMRDKLMTVRQNFKFAIINAVYPLVDAAGEPIAIFRKNYLYNIVRKRWYVDDPSGRPICVAMEDSILLSIMRRLLGNLMAFVRTNFVIMTPDFQDLLGEFNRKFTLFDKYVLDMTHDPDRTLDRRIALALGVMLDTGERR